MTKQLEKKMYLLDHSEKNTLIHPETLPPPRLNGGPLSLHSSIFMQMKMRMNASMTMKVRAQGRQCENTSLISTNYKSIDGRGKTLILILCKVTNFPGEHPL